MARPNDARDGRRERKVRLFVNQPLAADREVAIEGPPAHYLGHVMRMGAGEGVALFNGVHGEWQARIQSIGRGRGRLRIERLLHPQAEEPGPLLLFAPLKKDALDVLVQKSAELGADVLQPVVTRHTTVERVNQERLQAQAIEAAEQCGRLTVPAVGLLRPLTDVLADWPGDVPLLLMDERGGAPIADAIARLAQRPPGAPPPALLVGPEGGFAADEAADVAGRPFVVRVGLGPRILRAETAAIAALACWQAFAGDWRASEGAPPDQPREPSNHVGTQ
jgi:16S rRNA (uracil1498-N3)-methyltransferase